MPLKIALASTALLASLVTHAGQDPRIDYAFAAPQLDDSVAVATTSVAGSPTTVVATTSTKRVTASFKSASVAEVLAWLTKQGVSFVVSDDQINNKKITLNVVNQPIESVVDAVAASFGGHWERRGTVRVYQKGSDVFSGFQFTPSTQFAPSETRAYSFDAKEFPGGAVSIPDMKVFLAPLKSLKDIPGSGLDEKEIEAITKELQDSLKDAKVDDPAVWEKFSKKLSEKLQKIDAKVGRIAQTGKAQSVTVNGSDVLATLTPAQKDLQKKQGYLKVSDLTDAQRKLLGITGTGQFEISIFKNGESLKIKN